MEELINNFTLEEVTAASYSDLFDFVHSDKICEGRYECKNYVLIKISSSQLLIYKIHIGMENLSVQPAALTAKNYLLKKINSRAYQLKLNNIQNI